VTTNALALTPAEEELSRLPLKDQLAAARAAGIIPRGMGDDAAVGVAMLGRELGIPPIASYRLIHVIQGTPTLSAQAMLVLARKRLPEFQHEITESGPDTCTMRMRRTPADPWMSLTYTFKQAQNAGLANKGNWKSHPDDMLRNRVVSKLLKMLAPDVFAGVYDPDEMGDSVETRRIPHEEMPTTTADRVTTKLLGARPASPEEVAAAENLAREDAAFDAGVGIGPESEAEPVADPEGDPDPLDAEVEDWITAFKACSSRDDLKARFGELREVASKYDAEQRTRLKEAAARRDGELLATQVS